MNKNPTISVVCPTYNSEEFIIETLSTVLRQTVPPFELIVSDDGSIDNTVSKVETFFKSCKDFHTHLIKNTHKGPGATRNAGILEARGDWIAFIDSDDLWASNKIKNVMEVINKDKNYNFIFHNEDLLKLDGLKVPFHDFAQFFRSDQSLSFQVWKYCIFHTSTITCQKDLLLKSGLFDETLMSAQDWELWIKMSPEIKYFHIPQVLGTYVERSNNITNTKSIGGLIDRLKVMTMHWRKSKASIWEYVYMAIRRIVGFILREIKIIK
jgi:glycosyltransferase involved in cell wall biosynthesis